jgi:hypothetical protein
MFLANNIVSGQLHSHMEAVNQMPKNNKLWKYKIPTALSFPATHDF